MISLNRRLVIYILIDSSDALVGEPVKQLNKSLNILAQKIISNTKDPYLIELIALSVISFATTAHQLFPIKDDYIFKNELPKITAGGERNLGEALNYLKQTMDKEIHLTTSEQKGDYKPLVAVFLAGSPTDSVSELCFEQIAATLSTLAVAGFTPDIELSRYFKRVIDIQKESFSDSIYNDIKNYYDSIMDLVDQSIRT